MAADEEGFFEDWPKWSKPVFALSAMILLDPIHPISTKRRRHDR